MAVRPTLPDTTAAAATAAVILLFSLQFAASRSPSTLHGRDVTAAATESNPDTAEEATKFKSNLRLPSDNIKVEPVPESDPRHVPASESASEWEDTATVRSVPLTRLRFNDLNPIDRRFFAERFRYPGRECRHGFSLQRETFPVVTEIIRYVDEPAIPMEIIRYVDETAAAMQPKEEEEKKEATQQHHLRHTGRAFPRPVEAQPAAAELLKYVNDVAAAEAAAEAEAAAAQPKEEEKEEIKVKAVATTTSLPVRHSHHHFRHSGRAFQRMMEARSADTEILKCAVAAEAAAAQPKEEEKKEPVATITASPVHRSRYHLHRGGRAQPFGAETVRYTDAAAAQQKEDAEKKEMKTEAAAAAHRSRHQHGEANSGDKNEGFSKYMMKYNNRNLQRFGHQKFVKHLPHKRGRGSEDEEEKKAGSSFVKRIRKFLDF